MARRLLQRWHRSLVRRLHRRPERCQAGCVALSVPLIEVTHAFSYQHHEFAQAVQRTGHIRKRHKSTCRKHFQRPAFPWLARQRYRCRVFRTAQPPHTRNPFARRFCWRLPSRLSRSTLISGACILLILSACSTQATQLSPKFSPDHSSELAPSPESLSPLAFEAALSQPGTLSPRKPNRACWVWHSTNWRQHASSVFSLLTHAQCTDVYISVPHPVAQNIDSKLETTVHRDLALFIKQATHNNVTVWATEGDPHFALPSSQRGLKNQISALLAFNGAQPDASTRLAGLQLDIEPWSLPEWNLCRTWLLEGWLSAVESATQAPHLPPNFKIDAVLPYWIQPQQREHKLFFERLTAHPVLLTVMNYQTDPAKFTLTAQRFLRWGTAAKQHVRIAIERGKIPGPRLQAEKISFASFASDTFLTIATRIEESLWKYEYFEGLSVHGLDPESPNF